MTTHETNKGAGFVEVAAASVTLEGNLDVPAGARGLVLFAHGSGSSRHSPRNRHVAETLRNAGLATLLTDLLTPNEELVDATTMHLRFDIELLAQRLIDVTGWIRRNPETRALRVGYFGASTGAAAALVAAAHFGSEIGAVVSRGGRPDLAGPALARVQAPTLLLVGERDPQVLALNRIALDALAAREKKLVVVPGATHLFEEPGALEKVATLATEWFVPYLARAAQAHAA